MRLTHSSARLCAFLAASYALGASADIATDIVPANVEALVAGEASSLAGGDASEPVSVPSSRKLRRRLEQRDTSFWYQADTLADADPAIHNETLSGTNFSFSWTLANMTIPVAGLPDSTIFLNSVIVNGTDRDDAISYLASSCGDMAKAHPGMGSSTVSTPDRALNMSIRELSSRNAIGFDVCASIANVLKTRLNGKASGPTYSVVGAVNWPNGSAIGVIQMQYPNAGQGQIINDTSTCADLDVKADGPDWTGDSSNFQAFDPLHDEFKRDLSERAGTALTAVTGLNGWSLSTGFRRGSSAIHISLILQVLAAANAEYLNVYFGNMDGGVYSWQSQPIPTLQNAIVKFQTTSSTTVFTSSEVRNLLRTLKEVLTEFVAHNQRSGNAARHYASGVEGVIVKSGVQIGKWALDAADILCRPR